jgi:Skp family chaperone for outer membrane proteins
MGPHLPAGSSRGERTVKRTLIVAGALVALGVVFCVGRLWAQGSDGSSAPATPAAAPLRTRIAVINMAYLLKYYKKANDFNAEMQAIYKPYQDREKNLIEEREKLTKEIAALPPTADAKREELAKKYKSLTRDIEDNSTTAKMDLAKRSGQQLKILYAEIYDAARRYARAHDFDMVLQYADAFEPQDFDNPYLIERKLKTSPVLPLYMSEGMNISRDVVLMLNGSAPAPGTGGTPAPGSGGGGN